ncbi:MAG: beta-N-acetylhexosaminidase [Oligosphaeraceae bacterium]|nr:beta-N-acetylhexosaminidase [Oligosphaeraceae bacterium]
MNLTYQPERVAPEIVTLLQELSVEYPIAPNAAGLLLEFVPVNNPATLRVTRTAGGIRIEYGKTAAAARGIGYALSGTEAAEDLCFQTYAILYDCSRNPVLTVKHAQRWLRRLALLGYDMMMLYTKDAYQLPGETYFGYMRGAYSIAEIQAMDQVAQRLGVEMIASIQALGHLEPILRWPAYAGVKDTDNVIMVDNEDSYRLIGKMLGFWSEALTSRRIHIGMDETHDLGRGRFQDLHGKQDAFDLYNRHLKRVCAICNDLKLQPMVWSDMYFRLGNKNLSYYDLQTNIPQAVKEAIAPEAQLVYWDYYHRDEDFYRQMLQLHRGLGQKPVVMASGIWTWVKLWYDHEITTATVRPCLRACRKEGVQEVIYTLWGDDGGYCEFDSAFAGLAWAADEAFNGQSDDERIENFFAGVFGTSYRRQLLASDLTITVRDTDMSPEMAKRHGMPPWRLHAPCALWDDPLMGIVWHEYKAFNSKVWENYAADLRVLVEKLSPYRISDRSAGYIDHAWHCANTLLLKVELRLQLLAAYKTRDRHALSAIQGAKIDAVISALDGLNDSFRRQWLRSYKYYGLEVMQIKLAGLKERYRETSRRIGELLAGEIDSIPELEAEPETLGSTDTRYRMAATGSWFI